MKIYSRDEWGADSPRGGNDITYAVSEIYVHHYNSGITAPQELQASMSRVRGALAYHRDAQGWQDIGYSFLVDDLGNAFEGRGWGKTGAHTYGYNSKGYGICWLGDSNVSDPSEAAMQAIADLVHDGIDKGWIISTPTVVAHRDRVPDTSCCGDVMYAQMDHIRDLVAGDFTTFSTTKPIDKPVTPTAIPNDMERPMTLVRSRAGLFILLNGRQFKILNGGDETWEQVNTIMVGLARAGQVPTHKDGSPVVGDIADDALNAIIDGNGWQG